MAEITKLIQSSFLQNQVTIPQSFISKNTEKYYFLFGRSGSQARRRAFRS